MPIYKAKNEKFFKEWSPKMAYVLGFFAADGNMIKNKRGAYFIEFNTTDKDLIGRIRKAFDSNLKISIRKRNNRWKPIYRLQVGSKEIFRDLINLGLTPNKSKNIKFPKIPKSYLCHFIRGFFDGDGNVWSRLVYRKTRKRLSLVIRSVFTSGSIKFLNSLKVYLENLGLVGGFITKQKSFYRLTYSINDSLKLYSLMYNKNDTDLYLERKKMIFEKFIKAKGSVV